MQFSGSYCKEDGRDLRRDSTPGESLQVNFDQRRKWARTLAFLLQTLACLKLGGVLAVPRAAA